MVDLAYNLLIFSRKGNSYWQFSGDFCHLYAKYNIEVTMALTKPWANCLQMFNYLLIISNKYYTYIKYLLFECLEPQKASIL
jgi:hypothetical protein